MQQAINQDHHRPAQTSSACGENNVETKLNVAQARGRVSRLVVPQQHGQHTIILPSNTTLGAKELARVVVQKMAPELWQNKH